MRAVCIGRHQILSEHFCSFFRDAGMECVSAVGAGDGVAVVRAQCPDVVICDYDLLRPTLIREWERDAWLGEIPIIAVSMTRRPEEARLAGTAPVVDFLYLPLVHEADVAGSVRRASASVIHASSAPGRSEIQARL